MNIPISGRNRVRQDRTRQLLPLLARLTGVSSPTLKGGLRGYYQAVPGLLARSFLGPLVSPAVFSSQLKARSLPDRIFLPVFEAMSRWPEWNEPLAEALLREVIPALLGIASMHKGDNEAGHVGLALGCLAEQTGSGRVRLTSLLCPSYQYRRDRNNKLWHCSGELLPMAGPRFTRVAATLGRAFAPLTRHGAEMDWEFQGYTGETGNVEHLVDMGRFVHHYYRDNPSQLFTTLGKAAKDVEERIDAGIRCFGINARCGSLDRKYGESAYRIRQQFIKTFPDQLKAVTRPAEVEAWLDKIGHCGPLLHYFIQQETIYRTNVRLEFTENLVEAALREMLLYTHILNEVRENGAIVIDTESSANYMTEALKYLPAGLIFTRSGKSRQEDGSGKYTLDIRQPYNVVEAEV